MCAGAWPSIVRAGFPEEGVPGWDVMQRRERTVGCSREEDVTEGRGQAQGNCRRGLPSRVGGDRPGRSGGGPGQGDFGAAGEATEPPVGRMPRAEGRAGGQEAGPGDGRKAGSPWEVSDPH